MEDNTEDCVPLLGEQEEDLTDDIRESNEEKTVENVSMKTKDPVLSVIGEFGRYQAWLCFLGLQMNWVHSWLSLSLKFVGRKTSYWCLEGDGGEGEEEDHCLAHTSNASWDCKLWGHDQTQFKATIVQRWDLVCDKEDWANDAQSVFFLGCLVGVFIAGLLADRFGRHPVCVALLSIYIVSTISGGLTHSWIVWLSFIFLVGAVSIGMTTVRYTIQAEMIGSVYRSWANMLSSYGWVGGYMSLSLLAYCIPNMRVLEIVIGLSAFPVLLLMIFCIYESPKWLFTIGKQKQASAILNKVAAWNRLPPSSISTLPLASSPDSDYTGFYSLLSYPKTFKRLVLMSICWFSLGLAYFGTALHTPEFGSNVYIVFFLSGVMELPVLHAAPFLLNRLGRKRSQYLGFYGGAICLLLSSLVPANMFYKEWPVVTLALIGKMSIGLSFDCVYVWTSEMFPTAMRNTALSACSSMARLGAILAPLLATIGGKDHQQLPLAVYGLVSLGAGTVTLFLNPETKDVVRLPDTMKESEVWLVE